MRQILSSRQFAFLKELATRGKVPKYELLDQRTLGAALRRGWIDDRNIAMQTSAEDWQMWTEVEVPMRNKQGELSESVLRLLSNEKRRRLRRRG